MKRYILLSLSILLLISADSPLPKVLIIGDSISLGYTPIVQEILKGDATVSHNKGNAQYSGNGVLKIDEWLGDEKWDVIQFNFGLWDLYGWRYADTLRTPETYVRNLETMIAKMEKTGAKLIWVTTTPACPRPEKKCFAVIDSKTEKAFRKAALRVMKKHNIPVNDLYKAIHAKMNEYSLGDNDVHYNSAGYKFLAKQVANEILNTIN